MTRFRRRRGSDLSFSDPLVFAVVEVDGGCYHLKERLWIRFLVDEGVFNVLLEVQLIQEDEGFVAPSWEVCGDELELCSVVCD